MTDTAAPSYRLKLPCADEREFREKFLHKYVSRGVFVPSERPRPVGTRLKLKLEIKGGTVLVSGDGMVTSVTQPGAGAKPGMTVRLTALHHDSIQFSLSPSGEAATHGAHAAPAVAPAPKAAPATTAPAAAKAPPKSEPRPPPAPHAPPVPPPVASTEPLDLSDADFELDAQPDEGVMAVTDPAIPIPAELAAAAPVHAPALAEPAPEPSPAPAPLPPPRVTAGAAHATSPKRRLVILLAAGAVIAVAATVTGIATSRSNRASRQASARVEEQLRLADLRILEGRLAGAGGDSALDHLLEAKGAAPADRRVAARLALLADKFEQLGDAALARRNLAEATVHYKATLAADPGRAAIRAKLDDIASKARPAAPTP